MKKIVFLLLVSGALYAQQYTAGSFGYDWIYNDYKTSVIIGYEYRGLFIEAEQNTYMDKARLHMFAPFEAEYFVRAKYNYNIFFVQWEHLCIHGIDDYNSTRQGHDRFTIGFDTRLMRTNAKIKDP